MWRHRKRLTQLTAEADVVPQDAADWRHGCGKACRSAQPLSYPAVAAVSGAFLIGKSDYFISRQTTGGV